EFHEPLQGFDKSQVPASMWMESAEVVSASLAALGNGRVLVVPGEVNLELARKGLQRQLDAL
ncbi:MAG: hypothetical protein KDI04_01500, partial [Halieaceae bacterium]|nr:hypothetical protein [Halieaceae bacterium]